MDHLYFIERVTRHRIPRKPLPTIAEAIEGKQRIIAERVLEIIEQGELTEYKGLAIQLLEQYDSVQPLASNENPDRRQEGSIRYSSDA